MDVALKFVEKAIDPVLDPTIRQVGYIIYYRKNVSELNRLVDDLKCEKRSLERRKNDADRNIEIIEENVTKWIQEADETTEKIEKIQKDEGHTKTGCSSGLLPYLRNRHRLGRKAYKMALEVKSLIDKSKFNGVSYPRSPTSNDAALSIAGYVEFGSRKHTMDEIMKKLQDSTVKMIGVHGPGGVGKSTLIKEIAKEALDKKLFNVVVVVDVTHNPNLRKIQEEIAYVLGLRLEAEGETVRADRLRRRLKKEKENTLIILDDLWDKIDLNKIGIPFDVDNDDDLSHMPVKEMKDPIFKMGRKEKSLGDYKGCKILLTSRDKKVLSDKMDVNDKSNFYVGELTDEESLMLFQKVAGMVDEILTKKKEKRMAEEMSIFKQEIVKKYCGGLPMAIVTVGMTLRKKSESTWETTLEKLKKEELSGVQKSMEISVKMSYDHLESEELKSIFLLCAQMGRQQLTTDLAKYCFGLGILEGIYTIGEARERISTSIQKLKNSSLMQLGSSSDRFDMHDMVRDAALSIAHKEQNVFALRNGKLDDWPDKDELEKCTAISIRNCDIIDELPEVLNCPQIKFFQIDSDDPSLKIPDNFFEGMKKLRVLILTGFHLQCLPSSIKCLLNLRMLCLERCILDDYLSIIGKLKKLRILSFSGSEIGNLPAELGCLDKLQLFDISDCSIRKVVLPNFMSRWICLEELYIRKSLIKMEVDGETNQSQISFLSQLKHLHQLRVVDLCIPSAAVLPRSLFFDRLNDYKIVIGDFKMLSVGDFRMPNKYEALRSLALQLTDGADIHSQKGIKLLFKRVENLLLGELNGVQNAFCELNMDAFPDLKHLSIVNNIGIEYIINSMELSHPQNVFPNLESLCLYKLTNIKTICYSPVTDASFTKLKIIKVKMCAQLKNLFPFYMVKFLTSLETVDVSKCDSLEEIVFKEGQTYSSDKVEFHKLRSLTLQSLPSFSSFYQREITTAEDDPSLFSELVEISNLESLELSSINSHKIWRDQPLPSSCFQNLTKLTVKDCHNLTYLCSLSVASRLNKLKGLFISECRNMERIFKTEGNSVEKVRVFPKLEEIRLTELNKLTDIWQTEVGADSFSSLISVQIERCHKLDKIFPSHMIGWCRSLESLKVVDCMSVELIFEIKDTQIKDASRSVTETKLQLIHVEELENLRQIWGDVEEHENLRQIRGRDPGGILSFKNLRSIRVGMCRKLEYVLPGSVAKDLERLESIWVRGCYKMEEIVAWEDGSETPLKFPEVTSMQLYALSISRFYKGGHIECPKLIYLVVFDCKMLETFATESTSEERKPIFYAEKVISNLESMEIDSKGALWLQSNHGKCLMHSLKDLCLRSLSSIENLYWLLHRMPNLESLILFLDEKIEELVPCIVPQERLGTVLQLKALILRSAIKYLGLERDPVLQRLEHLVLYACNNLINLAPSSVSLTHLTYLDVRCCDGLTNLMASSTAKSMVQLRELKVIECKVKEIVTNEGNEGGGVIEVVFSKLISIELVALKSLTSFCSYKNCEFKFPSLERLIVTECPRMETFTESYTTAPKLQNILAVEGEEEEKAYWEGDLNATIQKAFKDKVFLNYMNLSDYPEYLERVWHRNDLVHENMFSNLKTLTISRCNDLVHAIPSHLLPCLGNLEELEVRGCRAVQVIFNINDDTRVTKTLGTFRLKKLSLTDLPNLEHIWDKDPKGIFCLQVLQEMRVARCNTLKNLFPASVAKDLTRLELLSVTNCTELVEIFSKDETAAEEGATKEFVFPCLTSLDLTELPALKYFYPGLHKLEWPLLKELHGYHCNIMTLKLQEDHAEEQALIQIDQKVIQIPSLEILSFSIGDTQVTWNQESWALQFDELQCFQQEPGSVLYRFLVMLSKIEKLELSRGSHEEVFSVERPNADYTRVLLHLKELELLYPTYLTSIGLEHSWLYPIPENLQILKIKFCGGLINLVPHTVSFSNLTYLQVLKCKRLLYLFTSSTAKSLCRLKEMKIERCESVEEIVSTEGDESHEDEKMIFGQLHTLFLKRLPKLRCFYPGNLALCFPSLEKVFVIRCTRMETFCPVNETELSSGVIFTEDATPRWEGDLNSTLRKRFEISEYPQKVQDVQISEYPQKVQDVSLRDEPLLQEIWQGSLPVPDMCFSNLVSLTVNGCQFLSEVLPCNLLPFLTKMKELEVLNCSSVKTIFDVKCIKEDRKMTTTGDASLPFLFSLKTLILEELPNLENVWNQDPHGILRVQLLEKVYVDKCKCLTSLFPASVAKDLVKLENLLVEHCEKLMVIVAEDNADPRGTKSMQEIVSTEGDESHEDEKIIFEQLCVLSLEDLQELKCFYSGNFTLCFPSLEHVFVINCHKMETFCHGTINANTLLGKDFNSIVRKAFLATISKYAKVQDVSLRDEPLLQEIWQGSLPVPDMCFSNLEYLTVNGCHFLSEVLPSNILPFLTKLEELEVQNCSSVKTIFDVKRITEDRRMTTTGDASLPFLFSLKRLSLEELPNLENVWNQDPEGILRVQLLEKVYVAECKCLTSLFPASVAKDLVKLDYLRVKDCEKLMVIVAEDNADLRDEPLLQEIWQGSLPVPDMCFSNLEYLTVNGCHFLSEVLPSNILPFLTKLEELEVQNCSSVKTIFDVKRITEGRRMTTTGDASIPFLFSLKRLILMELPNLENVWNQDPEGILRVQLLEKVYVAECKCLTSLFPASVAKDLVKLDYLWVKHCEELMVIVAEDNADLRGKKSMQEIVSTEGDESHEDEKIIFEQLPGLSLEDLQELKCFYSGNFTLCFPSLEHVFVINCHKMETFCHGTINADKLLGVKFDYESDAIPLEIDLNSTIRKAFLATSEFDSNNSVRGYIGRGD